MLLLLDWPPLDDDDDVVCESSEICVFGRPELVYDEWRDGDEAAEAGLGRRIAGSTHIHISLAIR